MGGLRRWETRETRCATNISRRTDVGRSLSTVGRRIVHFLEAAAIHNVDTIVSSPAPGVGALEALQFVL